ncbi:MAG: hypothetical protein ACTSVO_05700 [Candidatus Heimdallarchaeaceae archaeon]
MLDVKNVNFAQLKEACKSINESGLVEELNIDPIRTIGVKKEVIVTAFLAAVDHIRDEEKDDDLSDEVIDLFILIDPNDEYGDEDKEKEQEPKKKAKKAEKKEPKKKEKKAEPKPKEEKKAKEEEPKPEKKEKKKTENKRTHDRSKSEYSEYGHRMTTTTGQLDVTLVEGATMDEMTKLYSVDPSYIRRHFRRLKRKEFVITETETKEGVVFKLQPIDKK